MRIRPAQARIARVDDASRLAGRGERSIAYGRAEDDGAAPVNVPEAPFRLGDHHHAGGQRRPMAKEGVSGLCQCEERGSADFSPARSGGQEG